MYLTECKWQGHSWASPGTRAGKLSGTEVTPFFSLSLGCLIPNVSPLFILFADQLLCSLNRKEENLGSALPSQINCLSPCAPSNCWESGWLCLPTLVLSLVDPLWPGKLGCVGLLLWGGGEGGFSGKGPGAGLQQEGSCYFPHINNAK